MSQNSRNLYKCEFCEQNINQQEKENHYEECDKVASFISDHLCEFCEKVFNSQNHLRKHIEKVHNKPPKPKQHTTNEKSVEKKSFEEGKLDILQLIKNFKEDDALKFLNWFRDEGMEELHRIVLRSILQNQDHHKLVELKHKNDLENIEVTDDFSMDESTENGSNKLLQFPQNICIENSKQEDVLKNQIHEEYNCTFCGNTLCDKSFEEAHPKSS